MSNSDESLKALIASSEVTLDGRPATVSGWEGVLLFIVNDEGTRVTCLREYLAACLVNGTGRFSSKPCPMEDDVYEAEQERVRLEKQDRVYLNSKRTD